jgi:hypothetical protein
LLAAYHRQKRSRFIDATGLSQACTAHSLRALKAGARAQQFFRKA